MTIEDFNERIYKLEQENYRKDQKSVELEQKIVELEQKIAKLEQDNRRYQSIAEQLRQYVNIKSLRQS